MDFTIILQTDLWWIPVLSGPHSLFFDNLAVCLTNGWTWIFLFIALLFIVIKNNETMIQIGLVILSAALCILLADGLSDGIIKPLVMRPRPINDPEVRPLLQIVSGLAPTKTYSFFSAHAANTTSIFMFFTLLIRSSRLSVAMALWVLTNCWTRIYLGMHYPSDILVGIIWGLLSGAMVYILFFKRIYHRITPRLHFISTQYTKSGYSLSDVNLVVNVLLITFMVAIMYALQA